MIEPILCRSRTILIVEDNEDDVFTLKWAFRKAAIELPLQVVSDGKEALDYLSGSGRFEDRDKFPIPSLIFLDLKLPFVTGHEVLEWLRQQPEFATLTVFILSGSDESRDREQARANGANGYLVKPITAETLVSVLKSELAFADLFDDQGRFMLRPE